MHTRTPSTLLREAYSKYYAGGEKSDSPNKSRAVMARRISEFVLTTDRQQPTIVDLGAGKQSVEQYMRMLYNSSNGRGRFANLQGALACARYITIDIAAGATKPRLPWAHHINADAVSLPIADGVADMVVSNHAVDMLRADQPSFQQALGHVARVLRPDGLIYFQYHHASLFDGLCDHYEGKGGPQQQFYNPGVPNPFYGDVGSIEQDLAAASLAAVDVRLVNDGTDQWWEVEAMRASSPAAPAAEIARAA